MTHPLAAELRTRKPLCTLSKAAADELDRLRERVAELERALLPFAMEALAWSDSALENEATLYVVERHDRAPQPVIFSLADLGRAQAANPRAHRPTDEPSTPFVYDKAPGIPLVGSIGEGGEVK